MSRDSIAVRELGELSDEELIGRILERGNRDDRPFSELLRRYRRSVWRVALGFFGNVQDAEDMTQDVFFTAYRKLGQFRGESSFHTWLRRIASNLCKNELRRRSRRLQTNDEPFDDAGTTSASGSPGPEDVAVSARRVQRLALAMGLLTAEDRRLLRLVDLEQTPYKDVAELLGSSLGAVKMRVLRARARLREAFDTTEKRKNS